jgi:hypothetical protein
MPWSYVSRDSLKRRLGDSLTTDDATYREVLEGVTRGIDDLCGRTFRISLATRYYASQMSRVLLIADADLLAITTLATDLDFDGVYETTWTETTDYRLAPYNAAADLAPYWKIECAPFGQKWFPSFVRSTQVIGKWGYFEDLGSAGTLGAAISTTSTTSVTMTAGHGIEALQTILIDSEQLYVTAVTTNTLTVDRGVNGTTAATHSNGATVQFYRYPATVREAAVIQAARIFRRKDAPFGITGSPEFGQTALIARIDPDVKQMLSPIRHLAVA